MFCGSFSHVDDTPARSRRRKRKVSDNPYAGRGLDKFSAVLEELEAKKEKIIAQLGPQREGAWVGFVHSSSNEWMPIVVRHKDSKVNDKVLGKSPQFSGVKSKASAKELSPAMTPKAKKVAEADHDQEGRKELNNICFSWKDHKEGGLWVLRYWRPSYYCYVAFVLVLVCVVMFGRSFAIVCTSIWWYMIPALKGENTNVRKSMKMKEYGRRISGKKVSGEQMIKASSPLRILGSS